MKKKTIIWIAIIAVIVIGVPVYMHYTPVWVSISNVIFGAVGITIGWIAHVLYNKYVKE